MNKIQKILPLLFVLLSGATQMMAQDAQDEATRRLQARMDELRSQMAQMQADMRSQMAQIQAELDAMHGVNNLANAVNDVKSVPRAVQTGAIERTMPPLPPAVPISPEHQREAVGKETAAYETFSEESEPVPRLYNVPLEATLPGFFVLPGTQTMMRINGNLKTDIMFDPRPAGLPDSFIPSTIPIPQGSSTNNFNASIRESRFSADLRIPVSHIGTARTFIQFDFFGANGATTPRLRHFYAQLDNILVGQTNTVFMDPDAWPDIVEFQGIIHCRRDPLDVCLSCYFQNFLEVAFACSLEDIPALYHRAYETLMAHWSRVLPVPIHEVSYEELVQDQETVSRKLLSFCGLDSDDRCLTFWNTRRVVQTASGGPGAQADFQASHGSLAALSLSSGAAAQGLWARSNKREMALWAKSPTPTEFWPARQFPANPAGPCFRAHHRAGRYLPDYFPGRRNIT